MQSQMPEPIDAAALRELALFPLPNAVLLPGGLLPLHVFEPRYREMTRDCLAGSRTMAIALLRPGFEADYHGRPPIQPLCGVGTILCSDELPDGRFHLVLRGVARVRVDEELPPTRSYRRAHATLIDAAGTGRPDALVDGHRQLIALCDRLAIVLDAGGRELCELVHEQPDAGACADVIAASLVTDPRLRQAFLETVDSADRVDAAVDLLARLVCELAPDRGAAN
jgi:Lon protease-like protein